MKYLPQFDLYVDDDCVIYRRSNRTDKAKCHLVQVKATLQYNGYMQVGHTVNGKFKHAYVHRIIATAFCPNPGAYNEVDHINGIRTDNRPCNLRWVSHQDNCRNRPNFKVAETIEEAQKIAKHRESMRIWYREHREEHIANVMKRNKRLRDEFFADKRSKKIIPISVPSKSEVA